MVLLKAVDERGFVVATSYESRKGRELTENPCAALLFYWPELGRQVRVEGRVERVDVEESDAIFAARPRGAQLAAHASRQSERLESRAVLEERFAAADKDFPGDVPRPASWGGYRLVPERYEFWVHDDDRLHYRICYSRDGDSWQTERLNP
jgi:pyridoxamine 5'-phosphate oxidase